MLKISYLAMVIIISALWLLVRAAVWIKNRRIEWKRELVLMLVYICIIVVTRFTFCPFGKVDGKIQPLVFDAANAFPFRMNFEPLVHLFDYEQRSDAILNLIGNITMFIPMGIIWPSVYKKLNSHLKVIAAGVGLSLFIEILQLPFYDRLSDIDDLILNSSGFIIGYAIYLSVKFIARKVSDKKSDSAVC